ncbi:MAG TPA: LysE/ArgO family amino acid transporter [Paenirhodobacter sp.]
MDFPIFLTGITMGLSLIVAIGAQNAFVLRQGLRGEHVLAVCLICALSDMVLIGLGVWGFGALAARLPWLDPAMRYGGAAFLIWYGAQSLRAAISSGAALTVGQDQAIRALTPVVLGGLAITWLNPHVYLDTLALLGTISTQFPGAERSFAAGAMMASVLFFFGLGYGACWLRPLFAKPAAWRVLEAGIALIMWTIAARLLMAS